MIRYYHEQGGPIALPEILPEDRCPCLGCIGWTEWTGQWAHDGTTLVFAYTHDGCDCVTIAEWPLTGGHTYRMAVVKKGELPR